MLQRGKRIIVLAKSAVLLLCARPLIHSSKHPCKIADTKKIMLVAWLAARNKDNKPASEAMDIIVETITIAATAATEEERARKADSTQTITEDNSWAIAEGFEDLLSFGVTKSGRLDGCACDSRALQSVK
jgi:hypothetical protein